MKKYKFKATIQAGDGGGAMIFFPFNVEKEFGTTGKVQVEVLLDGVASSESLFRYGYPQHMIGVRKAIREQIGKKPGDTIEVVLWKDEEPRILEVPSEFLKMLQDENLLAFFETLSYTQRRQYCRWISDAKRTETRVGRLNKAISLLGKGIKTPG